MAARNVRIVDEQSITRPRTKAKQKINWTSARNLAFSSHHSTRSFNLRQPFPERDLWVSTACGNRGKLADRLYRIWMHWEYWISVSNPERRITTDGPHSLIALLVVLLRSDWCRQVNPHPHVSLRGMLDIGDVRSLCDATSSIQEQGNGVEEPYVDLAIRTMGVGCRLWSLFTP